MITNIKHWLAAGIILFVLLGAQTAAAATRISFTLANGDTSVKNTEVRIYLSYGMEVSTTDQNGLVTFEVEKGKGFWVEIQGRRLREFYEIGSVPEVIDIAQVGTMEWEGGK